MQSVSSRIWTRVAVSSSYDDNHYTIGPLLQSTYMVSCNYIFYVASREGLDFIDYIPTTDE